MSGNLLRPLGFQASAPGMRKKDLIASLHSSYNDGLWYDGFSSPRKKRLVLFTLLIALHAWKIHYVLDVDAVLFCRL